MWRIPVAFICFIAVLYILARADNHINIARRGGVRKEYNKIFSYLLSLPNAEITLETKSFVKITVQDDRCIKKFTLDYNLNVLSVKCKVVYLDSTAFDNGSTLSWQNIGVADQVIRLGAIINDLNKLP